MKDFSLPFLVSKKLLDACKYSDSNDVFLDVNYVWILEWVDKTTWGHLECSKPTAINKEI